MFNDNPWTGKEERKEKAKKHAERMEKEYQVDILYSSDNTFIYDEYDVFRKGKRNKEGKIVLRNMTASEAIFNAVELGKKTCVLNFASYKNPGGMFMKGSIAQEEALCHDSNLFNVLYRKQEDYYEENKNDLRGSMYTNKALYSHGILFFNGEQKTLCDVITCAAPNVRAALKHKATTKEKNTEILKDRIDFVLNIAEQKEVDTLILGAWGCGVFGQDPNEVARLFLENLKERRKAFDLTVFAVPKSPNGNYDAFKNTILQMKKEQ